MATADVKQNGLRRAWLRCRLDKGMFSNEVAVTYPAEGEPQLSVWVEDKEVRGEIGQIGEVRVRVFSQNGHLGAVLPSSYSEMVWVKDGRDVTNE